MSILDNLIGTLGTITLPSNLYFWTMLTQTESSFGQVIFPVYGMSGGIASSFVIYLVKGRLWGEDMGTKGRADFIDGSVYAIALYPADTPEIIRQKVKEAIDNLNGDNAS